MKIRAVVIALLLSHSASYGQTYFEKYDCGQWFSKKQSAKSWLMGYLSGINAAYAKPEIKYDPLKNLNSAEQAFLWVDNYCKANPLSTVHTAGFDLYLELQTK